jgi:alpha-beta hydrolase superfamily lysophospholipase
VPSHVLSVIESVYVAQQSEKKHLLVIPKAGHDLLFQSKPDKKITNGLFDWIEQALNTVAS